MGILDRIQAKIELFRLEQRYTRHRHRRSTFQTNAVYVDGEYVYQTPNNTGSSSDSNSSSGTASPGLNALHYGPPSPISPSMPANNAMAAGTATNPTIDFSDKHPKRSKRMSMPAFGGSYASEQNSSTSPSAWR
ncbi:hypothetical protein TD95_005304 [Thielaviopsis punctulata]|uniref:Uncharacterized protein n=1 Tax=Thielaviopsis punctulata TaxID=72032 RepID=A0A0F4Z6L6_9PEZI|nr:hypothetical protein TD95_005304 [Thielaviopsis punctulata]